MGMFTTPPGQPTFTNIDVSRVVKALEAIAGALQALAQGPNVGGQPAGDGLLKVLTRIAVAAEKIAAKDPP